MTEYQIIVADPPWRFASNSKARPGKNAMRHYECMGVAAICKLTVPAAKDAVLFLWATAPFLAHAMDALRAWGFVYKSNMVWDKEKIATGYWVRNEHEHCLIGRRGKFPTPPPGLRRRSIIRGGRREHSRKPDELQEWIDQAWPIGPRLEMFARQRREGWDQFGNEADKFSPARGFPPC